MSNPRAHVGILSFEMHIPDSQSLKSKRQVLKSLKDRIHARFNASVSEIGELDKWQRTLFGVCMIGNDKRRLDEKLQGILSLVESVRDIQLLHHQIDFV